MFQKPKCCLVVDLPMVLCGNGYKFICTKCGQAYESELKQKEVKK